MLINEFLEKHADALTMAFGEHELERADSVEEVIDPFVKGQRIEGITLAATELADYALLSIGSSVLGLAAARHGIIALDSIVKRSGRRKQVQLAMWKSTTPPHFSAVLSDRLGEDVIYKSSDTLDTVPIDSELDPKSYLETEILPRFRRVTGIGVSYWTENRVTIHGTRGLLEVEDRESLTIRAAGYGGALSIFALNPFSAVAFQSEERLLAGRLDLSGAVPMQARLQRPESLTP
ncbi:MAG TPA: hypothetical protein VH234_06045 [Candidatus Saccharimonadales bacterium]|jgi:hypothetical protein|nr:hypothetical protein [Candidatus Saccharimonadales bacterium]